LNINIYVWPIFSKQNVAGIFASRSLASFCAFTMTKCKFYFTVVSFSVPILENILTSALLDNKSCENFYFVNGCVKSLSLWLRATWDSANNSSSSRKFIEIIAIL